MTIKCPTPEVTHVTLVQRLLAKTCHRAPSINNDTMFLEEKEE